MSLRTRFVLCTPFCPPSAFTRQKDKTMYVANPRRRPLLLGCLPLVFCIGLSSAPATAQVADTTTSDAAAPEVGPDTAPSEAEPEEVVSDPESDEAPADEAPGTSTDTPEPVIADEPPPEEAGAVVPAGRAESDSAVDAASASATGAEGDGGTLEEPAPAAADPAPSTPETSPDEPTLHPPGELEMFEAHIADSVRFRLGRGLEIRSDDDQFALTTRVRLQVLYAIEAQPEFPEADLMHQLTLRRARLVFAGHFFGEENRYKFELAVSPRDQGIRDVRTADGPARTPLLDYYLEFRQIRELNFRIGQYKVPFNRQRVISSGNLQMVDRSIVNAQLTLDRDVGFDFRSRDLFGLGLFRYYLGVYMGQGRDAVGFSEFALMYLARIEVLPFGLFDDYSEVDFARSMTPRLSIGAAFGAIDRAQGNRGILGNTPADGGTTNTQHVTVDALFMFAGFSFQTEFILRMGQRNPGDVVDPDTMMPIPTEAASQGWGLMAQAGYLLPNLPVEVSGRYGTLQPLGDPANTSFNEAHELGLGLSYYVGRHPFKVQVDFFRLWSGQFDQGESRLRVQLQASL